jgi:hypothetical protein
VQKEMDQTAAVFGVPNEQDGPAPEAPEAQEENTPVIPQTEADDAQAGAALEPDVVPINPQPTKEAPSVELPDQPPAPGGSVEESPIDGNVDGKPATPPTWPSVEAKDTTQPPRVYNEAYDVLNLYVVCYTNTAAVADIVETHDKAPGHENRLRVLTDLVVQFRALAKTAQNKSNSACESVN